MTCNLFPAFPGFYCGRNGRLNPYWTIKGREGGLPTVSPTTTPRKHEKAGKFLARVGRATVIQMKLTYSGVGSVYCPVTSAAAREHLNERIFFFFCSSSRSLRPIVCLSVPRGTWISPLLATKHCNLGKKTKLNRQKNHPNPYSKQTKPEMINKNDIFFLK